MTTSLTAYCCPACGVRFALEGDPGNGDGQVPHCPGCGRAHEGLDPLEPAELEAWALWTSLDDCLDRLPDLFGQEAAEVGEDRFAVLPARGLVPARCPGCGVRSWLPPGAAACPVCGGELSAG